MQSTSQLWRELFAAGAPLQARAVIAGTVYTDISAPVIHRAAMQGALSVGNVAAASLALTVRGAGSIPRSAAVVIETRLNDGQTASEWLPQGTFYISRRAKDPVTGLLALECYDALLKANALWTPSAGVWPRTMAAVAAELAALLGLEIDSRTEVPEGAEYVVAEPVAGTTVRDALGRIAQAAGGSWIVTPGNRLRLVTLDGAGDALEVAGVVGGMDAGPAGTVTGVRSTVDGVATLTGDDSGIVVDVTVAPMIAADMAERLIWLPYQPFRLTGAVYDPAAELGDAVRAGAAGEVASTLWDERVCLGPAVRGEIAAPEAGEVTDEYPYIGGTARTAALARAAAAEVVERLDDALTQQEIFNRLTDNGAAQGLVLYNGELYINASYINAGSLTADRIALNSYNPGIQIPNEYDASTLLDGQSISDGWIVSSSDNNPVFYIADAVPLRGKRLSYTFTSYAAPAGGSISVTTATGGHGGGWPAPPPGAVDEKGELWGYVKNGDDYIYTGGYTVPNDAVSVTLSATRAKIRAITVDSDISNALNLRYSSNVSLSANGLQVGKFVVDKTGNVTFNGNVQGITPANIGAVSKAGDTMTGPLKWNDGTALPASNTLAYFLGIDAFADGGTTHYITAANLRTAIGAVNKAGDTMTGQLKISFNGTPLLRGTRTDSGEASIYLENNTSGWALGVNAWGLGAGSFVIGKYAGANGGWRLKIDDTGLVSLSKALPVASGGTGATSESGARSNLKVPYSPGSTTVSSFSQIPTEAGFYMVVYTGTDSQAPSQNSAARWWNVIQIGVASRLVQIANNAFSYRNQVFIRVKHDSTWHGWYKFEGTQV